MSLTGAERDHGDRVMWQPDQYRFGACLLSSVRAEVLPLVFLIKGDLTTSQISGAFSALEVMTLYMYVGRANGEKKRLLQLYLRWLFVPSLLNDLWVPLTS